jgi:hypothetical protein
VSGARSVGSACATAAGQGISNTSKIAEPIHRLLQASARLGLAELLRLSRVRNGMFALAMFPNDPSTGTSKPDHRAGYQILAALVSPLLSRGGPFLHRLRRLPP